VRNSASLGVSGRLARFFLGSRLTPLLAIVTAFAGLFAVIVTPREEEPQIDVTMANVLVPFPGASASDVERLVAIPAEQVLSGMRGVEHVWSVSSPGRAIVTVQFFVGVKRDEAVVRLHDTVLAHRDWLPPELGVGEPIVKAKGIDDVPIVAVTLHAQDVRTGAGDLERVAHAIEAELKRVPGTRDVSTIGSPGREIRVELDAARLSAHDVDVPAVRGALQAANAALAAGDLVRGNATVRATGGPSSWPTSRTSSTDPRRRALAPGTFPARPAATPPKWGSRSRPSRSRSRRRRARTPSTSRRASSGASTSFATRSCRRAWGRRSRATTAAPPTTRRSS
jgi:multidrug efflux pump subunit AcrB